MERKLNRTTIAVTGLHDGLRGDVSGLRGDVSGLSGDVSECRISDEERLRGVAVRDLVLP
jgi:hypothetical protein